jgi:hypothetical protein
VLLRELVTRGYAEGVDSSKLRSGFMSEKKESRSSPLDSTCHDYPHMLVNS